MIELEHIHKSFAGDPVVIDVSLQVRRGELVALLGGSGSGKSTTLQMVNRLLVPSSGVVRVAGQDVAEVAPHLLRRQVGYCFQRVGLFPHMSVAQNVGITCRLLGWSPQAIDRRVDELLELVELSPGEFRERRPEALSGGQQQRVGVARALAAEPQVLLFDEPFGALDPLIRARLQDSLRDIRRRLQISGLFVTHDVVEAFSLCDRVAVMHAGVLLQVGTPQQIIENPASPYVQQLVQVPLRQAERIKATYAPPRLAAEDTVKDPAKAPEGALVWPFGHGGNAA